VGEADAGPGRYEVRSPDGTVLGGTATGRGTPVILVHGAASDSRQWTRLVPYLADQFLVVAMDRRGRRRSGPQRGDHSLADEASDIAAVAASWNRPVHLVGHSSGARYALLAAPQIDGLMSLTLFEPPAPEAISDELLDRLADLAERRDWVGVLRMFFVSAVGMTDAEFASLRDRPIWPVMVDNAASLPAELGATYHAHRNAVPPPSLAVPTLLLVGEESGPELRAAADELAAGLARATVTTLRGEGHGAMCRSPELFAQTVAGFIAAQTASQ
jgi:pimeloyl-ACP methyl ester carboxylesterase